MAQAHRNRLVVWVAIAAAAPGCALVRRGDRDAEHLAEARRFGLRGVDALEAGELGEAESWLRRAAAAAPQDSDTRRHLAEALWKRGQRDEALSHAESVCHAEPACALSAIRAGQMRLANRDAAEAASWGGRAIGLDARSAEAWALSGRAHQRLGDSDRALADYQQALRYAPNDAELLIDVALLHRARGDHRRCLTTLHHLLDAYAPGEEPAGALALAGEAYLAIGRPQAASESLRMASTRGETGADLLYRLAEAEAACGRRERAIAEAERALATDAGHTPSRELLARLNEAGTLR